MKADPVLEAVGSFIGEQLALAVAGQAGYEHYAFAAQRCHGLAGFERIFGLRHRTLPAASQRCLRHHLFTRFPAVFEEIVRDTAGDIVPVVPDVPFAVAGRIDGIGAIARRHELRSSHRARIGTRGIGGLHAFLAHQQQVLLEFPAEELCPGRIGEGQRR